MPSLSNRGIGSRQSTLQCIRLLHARELKRMSPHPGPHQEGKDLIAIHRCQVQELLDHNPPNLNTWGGWLRLYKRDVPDYVDASSDGRDQHSSPAQEPRVADAKNEGVVDRPAIH